MRTRARIAIVAALLACFVFAAFVWPTQYRYDHAYDTTYRTNRFTGRAERLGSRGWVVAEQTSSADRLSPPAREAVERLLAGRPIEDSLASAVTSQDLELMGRAFRDIDPKLMGIGKPLPADTASALRSQLFGYESPPSLLALGAMAAAVGMAIALVGVLILARRWPSSVFWLASILTLPSIGTLLGPRDVRGLVACLSVAGGAWLLILGYKQILELRRQRLATSGGAEPAALPRVDAV